jgi:hypothetical protein
VGGAAVEEVGHRLVGGNHIGLGVGMCDGLEWWWW